MIMTLWACDSCPDACSVKTFGERPPQYCNKAYAPRYIQYNFDTGEYREKINEVVQCDWRKLDD